MRKRFLLLCLCALLFTTGLAHAEPLILSTTHENQMTSAYLADPDGKLLTPPDTYMYIFSINATPSDKQFYAAAPYDPISRLPKGTIRYESYKGERYPTSDISSFYYFALLDENGTQLTDFLYRDLIYYPESDQIAYTDQNDRCGVLDASGNVLLSGNFAWVCPNGQGGFLALEIPEKYGEDFYDKDLPLLYIDPNGHRYRTEFLANIWGISDFSGGFCKLSLPETGACYLNAEGANAFGRKFNNAEEFTNGAAIVYPDDEHCGLIDTKGNYLLEPVYHQIARSANDPEAPIVCINLESTIDFYNPKTFALIRTLAPDPSPFSYVYYNGVLINASTNNGEYTFTQDGTQLRYADNTTEPYIYYECSFSYREGSPTRFVSTTYPADGSASFCYLIDLEGNAVSKRYDYIYTATWQNGSGRFIYYIASKDSRNTEYPSYEYHLGFMDENGNEITKPIYSNIIPVAIDRFFADRGNEHCLLDENGNVLLTFSDYVELLD